MKYLTLIRISLGTRWVRNRACIPIKRIYRNINGLITIFRYYRFDGTTVPYLRFSPVITIFAFFFFLLFLPLSDRNDSIKHTNRRDKSMRGVSLNGVYFLTITQFFFSTIASWYLTFYIYFFCDNNICFTDWDSKKEKNNKW